ncbi:MAG: hypothetical protein PHW72_02785 [Candidatus Pacebacteria bacterium]|nr:hypothetical protein [Candidatus Paceibacterota bacterium]
MSDIMVVSRKDLFDDQNFFTGFQPHSDQDFLARILKHCQWMERSVAESDPAYKQPIAYTVILSVDGKVYAYQRSKTDEAYPEKRLQGKFSWGLGGHIKPIDKNPALNLISASMRRELEEEIGGNCDLQSAKLLGYINLEYGVHAVHFGLLYIIKTSLIVIRPKDPEIISGDFKSLSDLENLPDVEEWSKVALDPLKNHCR